jgi:hypothetical protein
MFGLDRLAAVIFDSARRASKGDSAGAVGNPEEAFLLAEQHRHEAEDELLHPHPRRRLLHRRG